MKVKILFISLLFCMGISSVYATELPEVTDHEIVKVYVFWRDGCGYCEALIEGLNEIEEEYLDYFEIVTLDVYEGTNGNLYDYMSNLLGDTGGVPYAVIGEEHVAGYNLDALVETALSEYQNDEYTDALANYADTVGGFDFEDLEYACDYKGIDYWNPSDPQTEVSGYVVAGIVIILVSALGYLIFTPKKN